MPLLTTILLATLSTPALSGATETAEHKAIALAKAALEQEKQLPRSAMTVRKVREVEWPDAGLGCPQRGQSYAQVVVPGHLVFLSARGALYSVHVGGDRAKVCDNDQRGVQEATKELPGGLLAAVELARQALAAETDIAASEIRIGGIRRVTWTSPDDSCLEPLDASEESPVAGLVVELVARGKTYVYHSDRQRVALCAEPEQSAHDDRDDKGAEEG